MPPRRSFLRRAALKDAVLASVGAIGAADELVGRRAVRRGRQAAPVDDVAGHGTGRRGSCRVVAAFGSERGRNKGKHADESSICTAWAMRRFISETSFR